VILAEAAEVIGGLSAAVARGAVATSLSRMAAGI